MVEGFNSGERWATQLTIFGLTTKSSSITTRTPLPHLIHLLSSPNDNVCERDMCAIGNIAGDSPPSRDIVLDANVMPHILAVMKTNPNISLLRMIVWTLMNLCRGKPQPVFHLLRPALNILSELVLLNTTTDKEVLVNACWALSYLRG